MGWTKTKVEIGMLRLYRSMQALKEKYRFELKKTFKMENLKSLILIIILLLAFQFCTEVETKKEIKIVESKNILSVPINYSRGFLIFDKGKYPNVNNWEVQIKPLNASKEKDHKSEVKLKISEEKNYIKLPKEFSKRNSLYSVALNGLDANGIIILQSNILNNNNNTGALYTCPGCQSELDCTWKCVGPDYAYSIHAYKKLVGDQYYLSLEPNGRDDGDTETYTPYYFYSHQSPYGGATTDGFSVIGPINTSQTSGQYCTATGSHISGLVYGIAKDRGPWGGNHLMTEWILGHPPCLDGLNFAIMAFNNPANGANFSNKPPLSCGSTPCSESGGSSGGGTSPNPCSGISLISGMIHYNDLAASLGCLIKRFNPKTKDWENSKIMRSIQNLEIRNLSTIDQVEKLNVANLIEENGNAKIEQKIIESGLYLIGIYLDSGDYIYTINEIK